MWFKTHVYFPTAAMFTEHEAGLSRQNQQRPLHRHCQITAAMTGHTQHVQHTELLAKIAVCCVITIRTHPLCPVWGSTASLKDQLRKLGLKPRQKLFKLNQTQHQILNLEIN